MKKLLLVLAVVLMAVPAMAAVSISGVDAGAGVGAISYTSTGVLPRAFALNITVSAGTILGVDVTGCQPFNIYMGTIQIAADGTVSDAGTPVAPAADPGALGGIGTAGITVEMGSLYDASVTPNDAKPAAAGLLIKVAVSETCNVTVASNTTRGNVVLEDATIATMAPITFPVGGAPVGCKYDGDGDGYIVLDDLYAILNALLPTEPDWYIDNTNPAYIAAYDGDDDGYIVLDDLYAVLNMLLPTEPDWYIECP